MKITQIVKNGAVWLLAYDLAPMSENAENLS